MILLIDNYDSFVHNLSRYLRRLGQETLVVRNDAVGVDDVRRLSVQALVLSPGPKSPREAGCCLELVRRLWREVPILGICLGHQLLALSSGARTLKMQFGHHGANHPVQDLDSKVVMISSQNHGFAVDEDSLPDYLRATHRSLFDGSLQGIRRSDRPAFGFQGHPEASPGPHDVAPVFDHFIDLMRQGQG